MEALKMPKVDASTLRSGVSYAVEKANAKDFAAALKALERIERMVGEAITSPANEQTAGGGAEKNALAGWHSARSQVIASLKELEGKIRAMAVPEGDEAIILVKAIQANLTENPATIQQAAELERYLKTDSIITDAESPNGFGIKINIRQPLLEALSKLKPQLQA
jgi:hypothetical protein